MHSLLILTSAELTRDPRARRAAEAGVARGWAVVGLSPASGGAPVPLEGVRVIRIGGDRMSATLRAAGLGGGRRDGTVLRELRGLYRLGRLARLTVALVRASRIIPDVSVVHANDFDTLPAGRAIARRCNARLVYDAHEIYTAQEADPPRAFRAVAGFLERLLARRAEAVVTVNEPIAAELNRRLGLRRPALVVHNAPPTIEVAAPDPDSGPLRVVYQGALGHGRQLEDLLEAAEQAGDAVSISIRVVGPPRDELAARAGGLVEVLEPVAPNELVSALASFDVGVIVTRPLTINDELAAPNKLFEYLMAGLAVAAPDLPGVAAILHGHEVGVTFAPGDPADLARVLRELAADRPRLQRLRAAARDLAVTRYNAEAERPALEAAWGVR